jgi:acetyltransferase-like isoleucine patch superfamily enzyme
MACRSLIAMSLLALDVSEITDMHAITQTGGDTESITIGRDCVIGYNVRAIFLGPGTIALGDYVTIGDNVKIVVEMGKITIGDWSTVHPDCLLLCKTGLDIGEHCWFGQNSVIDGTGGLTIENGVRVGMYSQLWTHVGAGEQIEGCTLIADTPSVIGADAWLVGTCSLAPGVHVGARTVALAGSNITKSCAPHSVLAGAPARVKEGLNFYRAVSLDEKYAMLRDWLRDYAEQAGAGGPAMTEADDILKLSWPGAEAVHFHKQAASFDHDRATASSAVTQCCVETKQYQKSFTRGERAVLKYLSGNKARFYAVPG